MRAKTVSYEDETGGYRETGRSGVDPRPRREREYGARRAGGGSESNRLNPHAEYFDPYNHPDRNGNGHGNTTIDANGGPSYKAGWSPRSSSRIASALLSPSDSPLVEHLRGSGSSPPPLPPPSPSSPSSFYMTGSSAALSVSNVSATAAAAPMNNTASWSTKNVLVKKNRPMLPRAKSTSDLLAHVLQDGVMVPRH